ncbi:ataxin-2 homolog [Procambarus clarkii]|uniref:ataxin-2 homolog n=1 Tax=Procambarus clarkii TaxID=6728 RepID=UPI0037429D3C
MEFLVVVLAVMGLCGAAPHPQVNVNPLHKHPTQRFHSLVPQPPHSLASQQAFNPGIHQQSFSHAPQQSFKEFPQQSFKDFPQQSFKEFPQQSFSHAPQQSFIDAPQQSFSHVPQQSFKDFPQQSFSQAPQKSFKDFPQQSFNNFPQQSFKDFPQQSFSHASQQIQKPVSQLAFNTAPQHSLQPASKHPFNPAAQTHDFVSQKDFKPASQKSSTALTDPVHPKWTGPVAATVPAGVDGPVIPVSDTIEVAAAKAEFFKAYQAELAAIAAAKAHQKPAAEGTAIHSHSDPVYNPGTPVHSSKGNQFTFSTIHAAAAPQHGKIHGVPSVSHGFHGVPSVSHGFHGAPSQSHDRPEVHAVGTQFFHDRQAGAAQTAPGDYIIYH